MTLEANVQDHKASAQGGVAAMNQLVNIARVPYVISSFSSPTLASQPIAEQNKVLLVNSGGTDLSLLNKPYLYNNQVMSHNLVPPLARFAWDNGHRRAAMLSNNDAYGDGNRKVFREVLADARRRDRRRRGVPPRGYRLQRPDGEGQGGEPRLRARHRVRPDSWSRRQAGAGARPRRPARRPVGHERHRPAGWGGGRRLLGQRDRGRPGHDQRGGAAVHRQLPPEVRRGAGLVERHDVRVGLLAARPDRSGGKGRRGSSQRRGAAQGAAAQAGVSELPGRGHSAFRRRPVGDPHAGDPPGGPGQFQSIKFVEVN